MNAETAARIRVKRYLKIIRTHVDILEELIHLIASDQDYIPPEVQMEIADAVRHYRAMSDAFLSADRRLRAT